LSVFNQVQLTAEAVDHSKALAASLALRGADAVHLASAFLSQSRLSQGDQLIFITSDHELKIVVQLSRLTILDPEEEEAKSSQAPLKAITRLPA
jgi:hypothetical protein